MIAVLSKMPGPLNRLRKIALLLGISVLLSSQHAVQADDTDVYMNAGIGMVDGSEPLIMFSLDYRANLGSTACSQSSCKEFIEAGYLPPTGPYTFFDVLRAALKKVFAPLDGVRVGLMLNHYDSGNCASGFGVTGCSNGGYVAMGFQPFYADDRNAAKARFHAILDAMPSPSGNDAHPYQGKELHFEFFRYLTGQKIENGHMGWSDYGTSSIQNLDIDRPQYSWDPSIEKNDATSPHYISPLETAGACTRIYSVNAMFQVSQQEDDTDKDIRRPIPSGGFGSNQATFPHVIRYLYDADLANGSYGAIADMPGKQNVTSYFLVDPGKINTTTTAYAKAGGTGSPLPLSENPDELVENLEEIFHQILSTSTTFVAASVPVNVFNRAEITNNVFIGLFQVDAGQRPTWVGNVKKLKFSGANSSTSSTTLIDVNGNNAVGNDGRIRHDALTFWTNPSSLPAADPDTKEVDGADGRGVARGGAGQQIPGFDFGSPGLTNGFGGRVIYYDKDDNRLAAFNATPDVASELLVDLNAGNKVEALELITFARGIDIDDLDGDGSKLDRRNWLFGDPLHSRPLPLNYGKRGGYSSDNQAIYVAVAANDGMLRMIKNTTSGGSDSGEEVWAFMPRTSMPAQKILRTNAAGAKHPYTIDGAPVAYIEDTNANGTIDSGEKVYLYVGLRRGGKAYYAFDISNPESPELLWTIKKEGDFAELGHTFSTPRVGMVDAGAGAQPVLMFGGGYDINKDRRGSVGTDDNEGNAIFVVDAKSGDLIWKARRGSGGASKKIFEHPQIVDSVPSMLTVADTDGDGLTDRIVVGDTGGNIWRADIEGRDTEKWKLSLIAAVGRHAAGAAGKSDDRRFFHRPDLVLSRDGKGNFDAVVIGSGDRPDPLDKGGLAQNWFYMIKDRNVVPGSGAATDYEHPDFGDVTNDCLTGSSCSADLTAGWRLKLENPGEKVLATPLTIDGTVYFTSFLPNAKGSAAECAPSEGAGRLYAVSLFDASPVINNDTSDDSPDNGDKPETKSDRFADLRSAGIPAEVVALPPNKILRPDLQVEDVNVSTRWRTYWFLEEDVDNPTD